MNGAAFEQVDYVDIDGNPGCELVVGRRLGDQMMRIAAVFSFAEGQSNQLINTIYAKFYTTDMDSDGKADLMVLREGDTEASYGSAVVYSYVDNAMVRSKEVRLSQRVDQIKRTKVSRLQSGEPALYISSVFHDSAIVTDVLTIQNGNLTNLNSGGKLSYSVETLRNYYLYMEDIDDDGVMEMPSLMEIRPAPNQADAKPQQLVYWYAIDSEGYEIQKAFTFHNVDGGWPWPWSGWPFPRKAAAIPSICGMKPAPLPQPCSPSIPLPERTGRSWPQSRTDSPFTVVTM